MSWFFQPLLPGAEFSGGVTQTITGTTSIRNTAPVKNSTGVARIQKAATATTTGKANIVSPPAIKTKTGTSRIQQTVPRLTGSWTSRSSGLPSFGVWSFLVDGNTLYAGMAGNGMRRSTNQGATWSAVTNSPTAVTAFVRSGDWLYAAGYSGGLYYSTNNGLDWSRLTVDTSMALAANNTYTYYSIYLNGIQRANVGSNSFSDASTGLTNTDIRAITVAPNGNIVAGSYGGGIFYSTNNGNSYTASDLTSGYVVSIITVGSYVFAGTQTGGVYRSTNNGATWTAVNTGYPSTVAQSLASYGSTIYVAGTSGTYYSTNNGDMWNILADNPHDTVNITAMVVDPFGNIFIGYDNGTHLTMYLPNTPAPKQGTAAIQNTTTRTKNGTSRINVTVPQAKTGVAKITINRFEDYFESGSVTTHWTAAGTVPTIDSSIKHFGTYSAKFSFASFGSSMLTVSPAQTVTATSYYRMYVYMTTLPGATTQYGLMLFADGSGNTHDIRIDSSGAIQFCRSNVALVTSTPITLNTWVSIQVKFTKSTSAAEHTLIVDGLTYTDTSADATTNGTTITRIGHGIGGSASGTWYMDDIAVRSDTYPDPLRAWPTQTGKAAIFKANNLQTKTGTSRINVTVPQAKTGTAKIVGSDRYWVGGSGNWSDATNHWAATSGGTPQAGLLPTRFNKVYFDSASSATSYTVTSDVYGFCSGIFWDNPASGTPTWAGSGRLDLYGSFQLVAGMTLSWTGALYVYNNVTGSYTWNQNGVAIGSGANITWQTSTGAAYTLLNDFLTASGAALVVANLINLDAATYNVNIGGISIAATSTVHLGSGTWTITGANSTTCWNISAGATLYCDTSTIKLTNNSVTQKRFMGGTQTYNKVWVATAGTGVTTIESSNAFGELQIDAGRTVQFTDGTTQTITTLTANGTVGNNVVLTGTSTAGWTISKATGTTTVDYATIDHSTATGGAIFRATNSTDSGSNTGWLFNCNQTAAGKASIVITTTKTKTGVSRIQQTVATTTTGTAKIAVGSVTTTNTTTGLSRIQNTATPVTKTGTARVTNTAILVTKTGKAAIFKAGNTQDKFGTGHIQKSVTATKTGTARTQVTATPVTKTGTSRVQLTAPVQAKTGTARITISTPQVKTGLARVTNSTLQTKTGTAKLLVTGSTTQTTTGKSAIQKTTTATKTGTARIQKPGYLVVRDNFNRTNETPIGGNWTNVVGATAQFANLISNHIETAAGGDALSLWNANLFTADQYSQVTVNTANSPYGGGPAVRSNANGDCFTLIGYGGTINLAALVGGSYAYWIVYPGVSYTVQPGDVLKLTVVGNLLTGYVNGVQMVQANDASYTSGRPGIYFFDGMSFDNFEAGNITVPGTTKEGIARIQKVVPVTKTGAARIRQTVTATKAGTARVQKAVTQDKTGTARVTNTATPVTKTGTSRIRNTATPVTTTGKARVQVTVVQTQPGKAAVQKTTVQTKAGTSRIQNTVTQATTGTANMVVTGSTVQTISGKAAIFKANNLQTKTGTARLQKSVTQTTTGKASLAITTTKTTTGTTRIQKSAIQTKAGVARLQKNVTQDKFGIGRVQQTVPQANTGTGRVRVTVPQTKTGTGRVYKTVLQTTTGKANLVTTATGTKTGTARIKVTVPQTQAGKASVAITTLKTTTGIARVRATAPVQNKAGKARITATNTQVKTGTANIRNTSIQTKTGTARLQKSVTTTKTGVSRISIVTPQAKTGTARVRVTTLQTKTGLAKIVVQGTTEQTIQGKAAILGSAARTKTGTANIRNTSSQTKSGIARILVDILVTKTGTARITKSVAQTTTGKASLAITTTKTKTGIARVRVTAPVQAKTGTARIKTTATQVQQGTGAVVLTKTKTTTGTSRIQSTASQVIAGKASLATTSSIINTGTSRIEVVSAQTISGTANLATGHLQYVTGKASIVTPNTRDTTGTAAVQNTVSRDITGEARIQQPATQTILGTARVLFQRLAIITGIAAIRNTNSQSITGKAFIRSAPKRKTDSLPTFSAKVVKIGKAIKKVAFPIRSKHVSID